MPKKEIIRVELISAFKIASYYAKVGVRVKNCDKEINIYAVSIDFITARYFGATVVSPPKNPPGIRLLGDWHSPGAECI